MEIKCPHCQSDYSHILSVDIFCPEDDQHKIKYRLRFEMGDGGKLLESKLDGGEVDYRARELATQTRYECEECQLQFVSLIYNHKGQCYLDIAKVVSDGPGRDIYRMPFGLHSGKYLREIPHDYLEWVRDTGTFSSDVRRNVIKYLNGKN